MMSARLLIWAALVSPASTFHASTWHVRRRRGAPLQMGFMDDLQKGFAGLVGGDTDDAPLKKFAEAELGDRMEKSEKSATLGAEPCDSAQNRWGML